MKRILIASVVLLSFALVSFDTLNITSTGAPVGSTGAPGDETCAKSGCHSDNIINSGAGILSIELDNNFGTYEPGKTYNITVKISEVNINRFGFQLLVLRDMDSSNIGTLTATDSLRTQIFDGTNQYAGRKYMTYRSLGTLPFSQNQGKWTFKWTAPNNNEGDITLYAAAISANDDGTDSGDLVYTKSVKLSYGTTNIHNIDNKLASINVYPNPTSDCINITYWKRSIGKTSIELYNTNGLYLSTLFSSYESSGEHILNLPLSKNLPRGIYEIVVKGNEEIFSKKIIVQ